MSKHFTHLSDSQWETIKGLVNWSPLPERGVPRSDFRKIWNSILFVLTRGCRWSEIPADSTEPILVKSFDRFLGLFWQIFAKNIGGYIFLILPPTYFTKTLLKKASKSDEKFY